MDAWDWTSKSRLHLFTPNVGYTEAEDARRYPCLMSVGLWVVVRSIRFGVSILNSLITLGLAPLKWTLGHMFQPWGPCFLMLRDRGLGHMVSRWSTVASLSLQVTACLQLCDSSATFNYLTSSVCMRKQINFLFKFPMTLPKVLHFTFYIAYFVSLWCRSFFLYLNPVAHKDYHKNSCK